METIKQGFYSKGRGSNEKCFVGRIKSIICEHVKEEHFCRIFKSQFVNTFKKMDF
jgi:hypothetical protein